MACLNELIWSVIGQIKCDSKGSLLLIELCGYVWLELFLTDVHCCHSDLQVICLFVVFLDFSMSKRKYTSGTFSSEAFFYLSINVIYLTTNYLGDYLLLHTLRDTGCGSGCTVVVTVTLYTLQVILFKLCSTTSWTMTLGKWEIQGKFIILTTSYKFFHFFTLLKREILYFQSTKIVWPIKLQLPDIPYFEWLRLASPWPARTLKCCLHVKGSKQII